MLEKKWAIITILACLLAIAGGILAFFLESIVGVCLIFVAAVVCALNASISNRIKKLESRR
ncbi:hypothetical protein KKA69_02430 [Patescibacteria group bacterium]|nr:hypothetical protein [Patescibacteria group bacterium]